MVLIRPLFPATFWVSMGLSIILISFFLLYLPFKKIKSKLKFLFIPIYMFVLVVSILLNIIFLTEPSEIGIGESIQPIKLIVDYGQEVKSKQDATGLFQDYFSREEVKSLFKNDPLFKDNPNSYLNAFNSIADKVKELKGKGYTLEFGLKDYLLTKEGRLYEEGLVVLL